MKGFDQTTNVILSSSIERVFTSEPEEETELVPLGVYIIRGDNIALIGEVDEVRDGEIDWTTVKADPINEVVH